VRLSVNQVTRFQDLELMSQRENLKLQRRSIAE
jgi:hypothetical protein